MLETPPLAWLFLFFFFPLFLVSVHYWFTGKFTGKRQRLPPSPPALPIIGHLHLIGSLPHVSFRSLARKYGPDVMILRLGAVPNLIVSSPRAAEAVLRTHDHVFASRPTSVVTDIIMYGSSDIGFAPYGEYWRQVRKLVTTQMLSVKKVQSFRAAAVEEVSMALAKINEAATDSGVVDISELLYTFANHMACRIVSGNFFLKDGQSKLFRELIEDTSGLLSGFNLEEYFPALGWVGVLKRAVCVKAERVRNRWADLLDKVIDDRVNNRKSKSDHKDGDFVDVMLSVQQEYDLTREQMKAILTDVFFASIDTSANAMEFTLAELMRRPHLMGKLQDEVRSIVPRGQEIISETDINNMTYLRAVIKESLRLYPLTPLLAPHLATADCIIDGYMIPAGTRVLVNAWAISRDSSSWKDAEEFIPERFIDEGSDVHVNFKGNDFKYLPFGAGRRMCPVWLCSTTTTSSRPPAIRRRTEGRAPRSRSREGHAVLLTNDPAQRIEDALRMKKKPRAPWLGAAEGAAATGWSCLARHERCSHGLELPGQPRKLLAAGLSKRTTTQACPASRHRGYRTRRPRLVLHLPLLLCSHLHKTP